MKSQRNRSWGMLKTNSLRKSKPSFSRKRKMRICRLLKISTWKNSWASISWIVFWPMGSTAVGKSLVSQSMIFTSRITTRIMGLNDLSRRTPSVGKFQVLTPTDCSHHPLATLFLTKTWLSTFRGSYKIIRSMLIRHICSCNVSRDSMEWLWFLTKIFANMQKHLDQAHVKDQAH